LPAPPKCGKITQIFQAGDGEEITNDIKVPYLGAIPMDPVIAQCGDTGQAFINNFALSPTAKIMKEILDKIMALDKPAK
jgi:ATP-binding protein involved in chromosome partitioning